MTIAFVLPGGGKPCSGAGQDVAGPRRPRHPSCGARGRVARRRGRQAPVAGAAPAPARHPFS